MPSVRQKYGWEVSCWIQGSLARYWSWLWCVGELCSGVKWGQGRYHPNSGAELNASSILEEEPQIIWVLCVLSNQPFVQVAQCSWRLAWKKACLWVKKWEWKELSASLGIEIWTLPAASQDEKHEKWVFSLCVLQLGSTRTEMTEGKVDGF